MAQDMPVSALIFLDVDGDSKVTAEEFSTQMDQFFAPMDTNGNGELEITEVEGFIGRDVFDAADTDKNGGLSKAEYEQQMSLDFKNADVDGDGVLN